MKLCLFLSVILMSFTTFATTDQEKELAKVSYSVYTLESGEVNVKYVLSSKKLCADFNQAAKVLNKPTIDCMRIVRVMPDSQVKNVPNIQNPLDQAFKNHPSTLRMFYN